MVFRLVSHWHAPNSYRSGLKENPKFTCFLWWRSCAFMCLNTIFLTWWHDLNEPLAPARQCAIFVVHMICSSFQGFGEERRLSENFDFGLLVTQNHRIKGILLYYIIYLLYYFIILKVWLTWDSKQWQHFCVNYLFNAVDLVSFGPEQGRPMHLSI